MATSNDRSRELPVSTRNVPSSAPATPRIVVFGIRCRFTDAIVRGLTLIDQPPIALVLPAPPGTTGLQLINPPRTTLPMVLSRSSPVMSPTVSVPTYNLGRVNHNATVNALRTIDPEIILVACFPRRIPASLYAFARIAALNIHPSLLPKHRGPDPLFWTLREGTGQAGLTIHELSDQFDAGPIYAQAQVTYADGTSEAELEAMLASTALELLRSLIPAVGRGEHDPRVQDVSDSTYETWPEANNYTIDTRQSARAAFNFIRGIRDRHITVTIDTGTGSIDVAEAVAYQIGLDLASTTTRGLLPVKFDDGILFVRPLAPARSTSAHKTTG